MTMTKTSTEQKSFDGRVMAIPLGDGSFGYGRALTAPNTEFYQKRKHSASHFLESQNETLMFHSGNWILI